MRKEGHATHMPLPAEDFELLITVKTNQALDCKGKGKHVYVGKKTSCEVLNFVIQERY